METGGVRLAMGSEQDFSTTSRGG